MYSLPATTIGGSGRVYYGTLPTGRGSCGLCGAGGEAVLQAMGQLSPSLQYELIMFVPSNAVGAVTGLGVGALMNGVAARVAARTAVREAAKSTRFLVNSGGQAQLVVAGLRVGSHAAERMTQRGISIRVLESALRQESFAYFHQGAWKAGYYDPASRVFAGAIDGELTTVIGNATRRYIENLMRAVP